MNDRLVVDFTTVQAEAKSLKARKLQFDLETRREPHSTWHARAQRGTHRCTEQLAQSTPPCSLPLVSSRGELGQTHAFVLQCIGFHTWACLMQERCLARLSGRPGDVICRPALFVCVCGRKHACLYRKQVIIFSFASQARPLIKRMHTHMSIWRKHTLADSYSLTQPVCICTQCA